jgi:hypothetical protein
LHLILGEEHRLKAFENRALRKIFGMKRVENLNNEELHNLYSSLNIIRLIKSRGMRWVGHVANMEQRNE